jgi:hypothetical protein
MEGMVIGTQNFHAFSVSLPAPQFFYKPGSSLNSSFKDLYEVFITISMTNLLTKSPAPVLSQR